MSRVIHFEIYATDPERAIRFYSEAFGWRFEKWTGESGMQYWLIMTGEKTEPGIDGGLALREKEWKDVSSVWTLTIAAEDIDQSIVDVERAGGKILRPKMGLKDVGWFASFQDPEGNILSLMQEDRSAS